MNDPIQTDREILEDYGLLVRVVRGEEDVGGCRGKDRAGAAGNARRHPKALPYHMETAESEADVMAMREAGW